MGLRDHHKSTAQDGKKTDSRLLFDMGKSRSDRSHAVCTESDCQVMARLIFFLLLKKF